VECINRVYTRLNYKELLSPFMVETLRNMKEQVCSNCQV